jgi:outer membrane protein TolC
MTMIIREISPLGALSIRPKTRKFPHPRFSVVPSISNLKLIFIIAWAFMTFGLTILSQPVQGASYVPEAYTLPPNGTVNFEEGVRIALYQSPYLTKSSLEIDLRRLDETDSRYGLFPSIDFRTVYYINRPTGITGAPYSLNFSTDPNYNPVASYFALKAQKLATEVAIMTHIKAISAGLERLGQLFLDLEFVKNQILNLKDQINSCREKLAYAENRFSAGTGTSLEVKEAQQGLKSAQSELEHLAFLQKRGLSNLKNFLGLKPTQELTPDLQNTHRQVVGSFDPISATWEQTKSRSYDLKIMEIIIKLQAYNIKLAKVKSFPTVLFTTQTPDPLSSNSQYGLYAGFGVYVPLWDGFKRIRNVSRQKTILKQFDNDKSQVENELENKFQEAQEKVMETASDLQLAQSQVELFQLKTRQVETSYQSGGAILPLVLDSRKSVFEAKQKMLQKALDHDKAVLALRQISGDLHHTYVHTSSFQN